MHQSSRADGASHANQSNASNQSNTSDCGPACDPPGASYRSMPLRMAGTEIVELRVSVGWSQADLAARIAYSQRQVSRWERGEQLVSQEACAAILQAVTDAQAANEETRLARYYLRRWLQQTRLTVLAKVGLG